MMEGESSQSRVVQKMTTKVTVTLSERAYKRIMHMAELAGHNVSDTLAEKIDDLLPPLPSELDSRSIESLPDTDVLLIADSMMDTVQSARMSVLLQKQQAEPMTEGELAELRMLMDIYEAGQLRKAKAWVEVTKRGLRNPPRQ
jgi:hypothetical protein